MYFEIDDSDLQDMDRILAEEGNPIAQYHRGLMYDKGDGVPQDDAEAMRWYRLAAEQGYADGQYNLALMYYNGADDAEAVRWWRLAAEQGHAHAQEMIHKCVAPYLSID
jgi:hypothetical protein